MGYYYGNVMLIIVPVCSIMWSSSALVQVLMVVGNKILLHLLGTPESEFPSSEVPKFRSSQVPKFPSSRNLKFTSSQVSKFPSSRNFKIPELQVPKFRSSRNFKFRSSRNFKFQS